MIISSPVKALRDEDLPAVLDHAISILENTGVLVENTELLDVFKARGNLVDMSSMKLKIPRKNTENMLSCAQRVKYNDIPVKLRAFAGVYQGLYLDIDGEYKPWTHKRVLDYAKLAQNLTNIDNMFMLGYPAEDTPDLLKPLYEKLYCWNYDFDGGKSIWETVLCEPIYNMWQIYADEKGTIAESIFNGTVYMISPLRLGKVEAEQFYYFYKKGLKTTVGQQGSLGVTTPVTLAGALAINLAEGLFINYLNHVFFDDKYLKLYNSISTVDMSTGLFQYGRPEQVALNTAGAQMAAYIGASFEGHAGLSDAKAPGYESAGQKVYSALSGALCYGSGILEAGLLAVDEVNSPIQMIFDDEMTGAINKTFQQIEVSEETLALSEIDEIGAGGSFVDSTHTFENFRESLWFPTIWSKESYSLWKSRGAKSESDLALEKYYEIMKKSELKEYLSEEAKRALNAIIDSVKKGGAL